MAEQDKNVFGRKVFFINPSAFFESKIIERLRLMEYEVYIIDDYRKAKAILRKNADSICYVCIEQPLTLKGWHNFIKSFEEEGVFSPLDMGIISISHPQDKWFNFINGLQYDAGLIMTSENPESMLHEVVKNLDKLGAMGLRKYVRANCMQEPKADALWMRNNRMFQLKIVDISSVGFAARVAANQAAAVGVNQIIRGVTLNLRSRQVVVDIKITAIKSAGDFLLAIVMFDSSTPPSSIEKVREYITENLQDSIMSILTRNDIDRLDYENLEFL